MQEKLIKKINHDLKSTRLYILSKQIDIPYATLWRITHGEGGSVKMETWEKIDNYYREMRKTA